ncbi:hypothetical protein HDU98_008803, partial [Podochytrium sp. JEL0797]
IHYNLIKAVYIHPTEAYIFANNLASKPLKSFTNASHTILGRAKPDLHLYRSPKNVVGLDLVNHHKYGRVFFEVPQHRPMQVAVRIQKEVELVEEIKDFHPTEDKLW